MPQLFAVQYDIVWEQKPLNHRHVMTMLEGHEPSPMPGSLIVLPEMFDVGFSLNADEMCEEATDFASERWCADLARHFNCFVQGASIRKAVGDGEKATNNAIIFNPDGEPIARYEKIHPFSGGREPENYRGGTTLATFDWHGLTVCPFICYDLRFPEIFRLAAVEHGAELFTIRISMLLFLIGL
ncbi:MAG: nitrilase-related carbon-nitrogen hydrolase, partial [Planctomycetota bacterium]